MAKVKYYYDSETLSYKKVIRKKRHAFAFGIVFIATTALFGFLTYLLTATYIDSPKEKMLQRENENLQLNYTYLNKRIALAEQVMQNIADRDEQIYRVHFEANPISAAQRKAGFGGINRYQYLEGTKYSDILIGTTKKIDKLTKEIEVQSRSLDEIEALAANKEALLKAIPAIQPIQNKDLTRMASGYGMRMHPILKYRKKHNGMDFTAPRGTPIYATGDGKVTRASYSAGFGRVVYIDHGFGYVTKYAHMRKYNTRRGRRVKRGDIIGYVGSSGLSTAPHLHYEVHKNGRAVNPINFYHGDLTPEEYILMSEKAAQENQSLD